MPSKKRSDGDGEAKTKADSSHLVGHRRRLTERFMQSRLGDLPDYELLEILLFFVIPRRDVKPLAKTLLAAFGGSMYRLLHASPEELAKFPGVGSRFPLLLRTFHECASRLLREEVENKNVLDGWQALVDYCRMTMGASSTENFRCIYLNTRYQLIKDDLQETGTIDHTPVYIRELVKRGLELNAKFIVLCHNHPGGDVTPSAADVSMTNRISLALQTVGLTLLDHVIVSCDGYFSFKSSGYI